MDAFQKANPGLTVKINTIDHNTFQENINNYLQGSPGRRVHLVLRATGCASSPSKGLAGDISDVWQDLDGHLRRAQDGLDRRRRQAVLRAVHLLPVGDLLPQERLRARATRSPRPWTSSTTLSQADEEGRPGPDRVRRQGRLARHGHLRPAQHADQRLRLPRRPDGRQGGLERPQGQEGVRHLGRSARPTTSPTRSAAPGRRRRRPCSRRRRACTCSGMFVAQQFPKGAEQDDLDFFTFPEVDSRHRCRRDRGPDRRLHDVQAARRTRPAPRSS